MASHPESTPPPPGQLEAGELKDLLQKYIPDDGGLPVKDLSKTIREIEQAKGVQIFDAAQRMMVESMAESADMDMSLKEVMDLLNIVIPPSPSPSNGSSMSPSLPFRSSTSQLFLNQDPSSSPTPTSGIPKPVVKRRVSARIRSESDSSSSSEDGDNANMHTIRRSLSSINNRASIPDPHSFPSYNTSHPPAPLARSVSAQGSPSSFLASGIPVRRKVLSNASAGDAPKGATVVKAVPSSWDRFQRPGAPSRRRRRSGESSRSATSGASSDNEGGVGTSAPPTPTSKVPRPTHPASRQTSQPTNLPRAIPLPHSHSHSSSLGQLSDNPYLPLSYSTSPPQSRRDSVISPNLLSGGGHVDERSFYSLDGMAKSPVSDYDGEGGFGTRQRDGITGLGLGSVGFPRMRNPSGGGGHGQEGSLGMDGAEGTGDMGPRHVRDSNASSTSISDFHDKLSDLQKANNDLTRKLKATETEMEQTASDHEAIMEEYQLRMDEMKEDLNSRRKEEKELKGKERAYLIQIQSFESDITKLHTTIEHNKTAYSALMQRYQEQIASSEELRESVREKDIELQDARETADVAKHDVERWVREQALLTSANALLERDLSIAREAEAFLTAQKLENLGLKETISKMNGDLADLRLTAASLAKNSSAAERAGSAPGTLSRSLDQEFLRGLREGGVLDGEEGSGMEDGGEEGEGGDAGTEDETEEGRGRRGGGHGQEDSFIETLITRRRVHGSRTSKPNQEQPPAVLDLVDVGVQSDPLSDPDPVPIQLPPTPTPAPSRPSTKEISIQTDESCMAGGLPAYTPKAEDALLYSKITVVETREMNTASSSSIDLHPSISSPAVPRRGWGNSLRRRTKEAIDRSIPFRLSPSSSSSLSSPDDPSSLPSLSEVILRYGALLALCTATALILGYHLGKSAALSAVDNPFFDALAADRALWLQYNNLARAQGAGIGFSQVSHGMLDKITRRVPS